MVWNVYPGRVTEETTARKTIVCCIFDYFLYLSYSARLIVLFFFFFACQHSYTFIWWCEMSETDILMLNVKYRQTDKQTDSQSANVPRDNNGMLHLSFLLFVMLPLARISRTHLLHRRVSALSHHCTDLAVSGHTATLLLFNLHTIVYLFLSPYLS